MTFSQASMSEYTSMPTMQISCIDSGMKYRYCFIENYFPKTPVNVIKKCFYFLTFGCFIIIKQTNFLMQNLTYSNGPLIIAVLKFICFVLYTYARCCHFVIDFSGSSSIFFSYVSSSS